MFLQQTPPVTGSIAVLHVDDEPGFAELTAEFLERESEQLSVRTETSAEDALETVRRNDLDCIVSDHDMPGMTGIELLEHVRSDDPELPFILFTGKGSEEVASKAVSAGVTDYLQKETGTDHYTLLANRIENAFERHQSQRAVEQQKRRLKTLVSNLPGVVYRCRNESGWPMESVEGECEALTGYSVDRLEDGTVLWGDDIVHPDDHDELSDEIQRAVADNDSFQCTYRITTAGGETKWVWERGRSVATPGRSADRLEGFITDITEQKQRERRFEAIFNNTYQFTGLTEPDGTIIEANETALSFAGIEWDAVIGTKLWESAWFQSSDHARTVAQEAVEMAQDGEMFRDEITIQGDDDQAFIDFSVRPVTNADGEVTELIPEGRNISKLQQQNETLRKRNRQFEAIFNDPNLLVGLLALDGTIRDVNETAVEYIDADRSEVVGQKFWDAPWWTGEQISDVEGWIADAASGEYVTYEAVHPSEDGEGISVEGSFRPVTDDGEVTRIVASAKDVTERKRRERELRERKERFDEFTSFVSHDLQSPISTVQGRLELALETGDMTHVENAATAIERVDDLRDDLVTSLRTGDIVSSTEQTGVETILEEVWTTVDPPETASFTIEESVHVDVDADAFQRLLENLVGNSIEHGDETVNIRVGDLDNGMYYEDSGPGIDPDLRDRVFTPGFSTKNGEQGIGMGMASVRQIVLAHGGSISIGDAEQLGGVRFEITLPEY